MRWRCADSDELPAVNGVEASSAGLPTPSATLSFTSQRLAPCIQSSPLPHDLAQEHITIQILRNRAYVCSYNMFLQHLVYRFAFPQMLELQSEVACAFAGLAPLDSRFRSQRLAQLIGRHITPSDWSAKHPFRMHLFVLHDQIAAHPISIFDGAGPRHVRACQQPANCAFITTVTRQGLVLHSSRSWNCSC